MLSKPQESSMNEDHGPFKEMVSNDGEQDDALSELEFNFNQLCAVSPEFAPENLDADGLIDFDAEVATN